MRHDKRGEDGTYRPLTPVETRASSARHLTQTHAGPFTHSREPKRQTMVVDPPLSTPMFRDKRPAREPFKPRMS